MRNLDKVSQKKLIIKKSRFKDQDVVKDATKPTMKRMTLDVSPELHQKIKLKAVLKGKSMAELIRTILEKEFL